MKSCTGSCQINTYGSISPQHRPPSPSPYQGQCHPAKLRRIWAGSGSSTIVSCMTDKASTGCPVYPDVRWYSLTESIYLLSSQVNITLSAVGNKTYICRNWWPPTCSVRSRLDAENHKSSDSGRRRKVTVQNESKNNRLLAIRYSEKMPCCRDMTGTVAGRRQSKARSTKLLPGQTGTRFLSPSDSSVCSFAPLDQLKLAICPSGL